VTRTDVFEGTVEVIRKTFRAPDLAVTDETTATEVAGWDSLRHASLLIRLEKRFNVRIPDEAAYNLKNVGELVDSIAALVAE
jgi:acyl carrier protein